ncbi:heat stress transcription factor A-4c-like isoform X1 [Daucus carota subsp. sativus]|uniref:heat stress transcription factor A-4c-like isoform X1 n=1 Tax=Daucus carota subsp. sativus TaxID=79200 RepID=UPI0030839FCB
MFLVPMGNEEGGWFLAIKRELQQLKVNILVVVILLGIHLQRHQYLLDCFKVGFRKIDPDHGSFLRGQKHLLPRIHCRKPIHSHSAHQQGPLNDSERQELEDEIVKLKHDKHLLPLELQRHKEESQGFEIEVHSLSECLKNIENRQRNTITFLAQILQKHGTESGFKIQVRLVIFGGKNNFCGLVSALLIRQESYMYSVSVSLPSIL